MGSVLNENQQPDDWAAPLKDKDAFKWLNDTLGGTVVLTEDDTGHAEVSALEEKDGSEGPPSSLKRSLKPFERCMTCAKCVNPRPTRGAST